VTQRGARQVLALGNERFMVPEVAFRPSDLGVAQGGIAQAAAAAAAAAHPDLRPLLLRNVVAVGGLARCPGFAARLAAELRALVPDELEARPPRARPPACPPCRLGRRPRASQAAAAPSRIGPGTLAPMGVLPLAHAAARRPVRGSWCRASRPTRARRAQVAVHTPADPVLAAWQGGAALGASPEYAARALTRAEYEERGAGGLAA